MSHYSVNMLTARRALLLPCGRRLVNLPTSICSWNRNVDSDPGASSQSIFPAKPANWKTAPRSRPMNMHILCKKEILYPSSQAMDDPWDPNLWVLRWTQKPWDTHRTGYKWVIMWLFPILGMKPTRVSPDMTALARCCVNPVRGAFAGLLSAERAARGGMSDVLMGTLQA
jgi:hypothetical protein